MLSSPVYGSSKLRKDMTGIRREKENLKFWPKKKGVTISEVLLAAVILATALTALLMVFITIAILTEANRNTTRAITHAQYVLEDIKNTEFTTVQNNGDSLWDWNTTTINSQGLSSLSNESINTEVSGSDLLDITVVVSWHDRGGRNRNTTLETLLAEP